MEEDPDLGEPLPEWATPVFVVDQDAKGLLCRLVCAYWLVNAAMEFPTFPSADPHRAFKMALEPAALCPSGHTGLRYCLL